jgi:hypothetical protein
VWPISWVIHALVSALLCVTRLIMSKREAPEDSVAVEEGHNDAKKQKTETTAGVWEIPAKFTQVKEELNCQPWNADVTVQDLITEVVGKANTDAFFVAGMRFHHYFCISLQYESKTNK